MKNTEWSIKTSPSSLKVERRTSKPMVAGSIPVWGTEKGKYEQNFVGG